MELPPLRTEILKAAKEIEGIVLDWRRDFHAHPEVGFQEKRTARIVADALRKFGAKVERVAGTGVVGTIDCRSPIETVAFRADMDALPMDEETSLPFRSQVPGVAHACGHDAHTAMLLGTAALLSRFRTRLRRRVKLLFQPCEESAPGGARAMVNAGVMKGVAEVFALHVDSMLPSGVLSTRPGPMLASCDRIEIKIIGKGGHGALPHECLDPIPIAAEVVAALQTIVSRKVKPTEAAVVSICRIQGGTAFNIIPAEVEMIGTVRTLKEAIHRHMPAWIERIVRHVTRAHGADYELRYAKDYPCLTNHPATAARIRRAAEDLFGAKLKVRELPPSMGAEDFSLFLQKAPGAMAMLGAGGKDKSSRHPHHSPRFLVDESVFHQGPALFAYLALR